MALSLPFSELKPLPKGDPVPLPLLAKREPSSNWLDAEDDGSSGEEAEGNQGTSDGHVRVRLLLLLKSVKIATNLWININDLQSHKYIMCLYIAV